MRVKSHNESKVTSPETSHKKRVDFTQHESSHMTQVKWHESKIKHERLAGKYPNTRFQLTFGETTRWILILCSSPFSFRSSLTRSFDRVLSDDLERTEAASTDHSRLLQVTKTSVPGQTSKRSPANRADLSAAGISFRALR